MKNDMEQEKRIDTAFNQLSGRINQWFLKLSSNLRFSISLRISLNYFWLLIRTTLILIIIFSMAFVVSMVPRIMETDNRLFQAFENARNEQVFINPFTFGKVKLAIYNAKNEVIYSDLEQGVNQEYLLFLDENNQLQVLYTRYEVLRDQDYRIVIQHDLMDYWDQYKILLVTLVVIEFLRLMMIMGSGKQLNKNVLRPIKDMTQMAQQMNANNLNKRINIAGTKNELKDLAATINLMIERIETSYNSQKQFVSDASHELRTPIAVIQGYANLLNRWGKENKEVMDEAIMAIVNESTNMQDLVNKLLFLARHDKKTWKLDKESFNIGHLMDELAKDTELIAESHIIEKNILGEYPIYGDKNSIKQALRIFIDNAIKYTNPGGRIGIKCYLEDRFCVIEIEDTGVGISEDDIGKIFNRFYRADEGRQMAANGHGLGLSIAKLIILAHNGKIKVRSKLGIGTNFYIYFPIVNDVS